jgi:hypothetical protein
LEGDEKFLAVCALFNVNEGRKIKPRDLLSFKKLDIRSDRQATELGLTKKTVISARFKK